MTRQELIKLQRTYWTFSQSLLQYLGTFSRETEPAGARLASASGTLARRWDMNNWHLVIPDSWIVYPGNHGKGHAWGLQKIPNSPSYLA